MTTEQDVAALAAVIRAVDGKSYREEREKELQELRKRRLAVKLLREGFEKALLELSQEDEATRIELLSQRKLELTRLREAGLTSARKGDLAHAATEADLHAEEEKIRIELLRLEALQRKAKEEEEAKRKREEEAKLKKARDDEKAKHQKEEEEKIYVEAHVEVDLKQHNTKQEQQEIENYLELDDSAGISIISPIDITTGIEQLHIVNATPKETCCTPNDIQSVDLSNETALFSTDSHQVEENLGIDIDGEPEPESMEVLHLKHPTEASTPHSNFGRIKHEKESTAEAEGNEKLDDGKGSDGMISYCIDQQDEANEKNRMINAEVNGAMTKDSQNITNNDEAHLLPPSATDNLNSLRAVENNDATDKATEISKPDIDENLGVTSSEYALTDSLTEFSSVLSIPGSTSHLKELQSSLPNDSKLTQTKEVLNHTAALDSAVFTTEAVEEKDGTDIDIIAAEDGLVTEREPVSIMEPVVVETSLPINITDKASGDEIVSSMFNKEVETHDKETAVDYEQHEPITSRSIEINHEEALIEETDHFPSNITQSTILAASSTDLLEEKVDGAMLTADNQSAMNNKDMIPTVEQQATSEHALQSVAAEESHENVPLVHSAVVSLKDKEQIAVVTSDEADVAIIEEVPYDSPLKCCKTVNTDPSVSPTINNNSEDPAAATNTVADMDVQYQEESSPQVKLTTVADVFSPSKDLVGKKLDVESHSAVDSISCEISPSGNMEGSPERLHASGKSNPVPHYARFRTIGRNSYDRAYYLETKEKEETS